jgi:hypothetical protein
MGLRTLTIAGALIMTAGAAFAQAPPGGCPPGYTLVGGVCQIVGGAVGAAGAVAGDAVNTAGAVATGAVDTAGAIASAPFRMFSGPAPTYTQGGCAPGYVEYQKGCYPNPRR